MNNPKNIIENTRGSSKTKYTLQLFITGATPNSSRAIVNIKAICEQYLKGRYELEIVDVYIEKERARQAQIVALPMLIKKSPLPLRKLIGDMSKTEKVLEALGI
jgi:circadian clock protein KaiB